MRKIVLASASPRRKELLPLALALFPGDLGFTVRPAECEESLPEGLAPEEMVTQLAECKALASAALGDGEETVIGCDTLVFLDGKPFGKPRDAAEAEAMLMALSGREHQVLTGVCLRQGEKELLGFERTGVEFYPLEAELVRAYLATGEPMDKAGAYGMQGKGSVLVKGIHGCYFNVVGLPVAKLCRMLGRFWGMPDWEEMKR